jgi:hypothetical protein
MIHPCSPWNVSNWFGAGPQAFIGLSPVAEPVGDGALQSALTSLPVQLRLGRLLGWVSSSRIKEGRQISITYNYTIFPTIIDEIIKYFY